MKRFFALTVAMAMMLAGAAAATEQLARGLELFDRSEFDAAAQVLSPLADAGDAKAQYVLGIMYLTGMAKAPDDAAAAKLIGRAGEAGYDKAQLELARMYREGHGVEQDFAKSFSWSIKAAEAGDVGAQLQVADAYAFGHGVERDTVEAYKWYEIGASYWGPLAMNAREFVAASMSQDQIATAKSRADDWLKIRASKN